MLATDDQIQDVLGHITEGVCRPFKVCENHLYINMYHTRYMIHLIDANMLFCHLLFFSQTTFLEKIISGIPSECQTLCILIRSYIFVCKCYQQTTHVGVELNIEVWKYQNLVLAQRRVNTQNELVYKKFNLLK